MSSPRRGERGKKKMGMLVKRPSWGFLEGKNKILNKYAWPQRPAKYVTASSYSKTLGTGSLRMRVLIKEPIGSVMN
jgi:hypothetical protein